MTLAPPETHVSPETDEVTRPTPRRPRSHRVLASLVLAAFAVLFSAGCSVQEMREWFDWQGIDHSQMSDAEVQPYADYATEYWANWLIEYEAEQRRAAAAYLESLDLAKFDHVLNDDQLYRLRWCESGDNYGAIGYRGLYRGAYQFSPTTWDGVARQHFPKYVGLDPAAAAPAVQDAMARALWSMRGPQPWPVCGYRV
jgi:hypothetical protein